MHIPDDEDESAEPDQVLVWDLATRLFHWGLVILVAISVYTGLVGGFEEMDIHMLSGYGILGLVTFRVAWGFVGPRHVRFGSFLRGPRAVIGHLRELPSRKADDFIGHNPAGGLAIVALLLVLLIQAGTGLFSNDDIMLEGPLVHLIDYDTSRDLTRIHRNAYYALLGLVGLHLAAIAFYTLYKRSRLIMPMITGYKRLVANTASVSHRLWLALPLAGAVGASVYWLVNHV